MDTTTMRTQSSHDTTFHGLYAQQQAMGMYSMAPQYAAQPPTLYSNGPSVMTPTGSPRPTAVQKPAILLDTDFDNTYYPSTPPLSTSGSTVGSPKSFDGLQTPMNPMFSGLDESETAKDVLEPVEVAVLDWSSCGSPPMTPMYLQSQLSKASSSLSSATSDPFTAASRPSLSPSPAPYAHSVASEQDVDFCDPRNLTVSAGSVNSTLAPEASVNISLGEDDAHRELAKVVAVAATLPTFEFNPEIPDGLPSFEDLSDLESEEDFVNSLVNLGDSQDISEIGRPRACTGSSVVSLGHGSFIGDEDLSFDDVEGFEFASLPSPPSSTGSFVEDLHRDKRVKKSHKKEARIVAPVMNAAATDDQSGEVEEVMSPDNDDGASDTSGSSGSENGTNVPAPANRRGRKQSLTEDPSKTFVCDLCNRRFRRQEHLKRHYRSLHTQEKPFECHECGKKFSRSDNLAQHARTHGSGAIVMNLLEEGEVPSFEHGTAPPAGPVEDYSAYGKVLFQIASEIPGSASDMSSEEGVDDGKKKRKRSD